MINSTKNYENGTILITILIISVILLMLVNMVVYLNYYNLSFTSVLERREQALKIAEAGVSYAIYSLNLDPSWGLHNEFIREPMEHINGRFEITFDKSKDYFSSNYLDRETCIPEGLKEQTWQGAGVPAFSMDLIVTGIVERDTIKTVRRLRILLMRDSIFGSALASGQIDFNARSIFLSREPSAKNPSQAGLLHSNSLMSKPGYAIKTLHGTDITQIILNGGVASAQGDIDIKEENLDISSGSKVDPVKQSKTIKPIDIDATMKAAENNANISKVNGQTFIVNSESISPSLAGATVQEGRLYIKDNIYFKNNDVRFEFNYNDLSSLTTEQIKNAGLYLGDPDNPAIKPAIYIGNGKNLTVAGSVKGNGSIISSGETRFIGESNLIAPEDPGVVIVSKKDLLMSLPSVTGIPLDLSFTGLVYTHGDARINILDPSDEHNPANNFSGGQWPPDWENRFLKGTASEIVLENEDGSGIWNDFSDSEITVLFNIQAPATGTATFKRESDGYSCKYLDTGPEPHPYPKVTIRFADKEGQGEIPIFLTHNEIWNIRKDEPITGSGGSTQISAKHVNKIIAALDKHCEEEGLPKVDPDFHITGALVSIDPNNPVPINTGIEAEKGRINVDIKKYEDPAGGHLSIKYSSRYLKLLQAAKTYTGYKIIHWMEL